MIDKDLLKKFLKKAIDSKKITEEYTNEICNILNDNYPLSNHWYYHNGFFCIDVPGNNYSEKKHNLQECMDFIEDIVQCGYCYTMNSNYLTFMISLTTLFNKL